VKAERAQLGLLAALAATLPVSIFASEILLALGVVVLGARLLTHRTRLARTALDTPLLAFGVWTLLSASFAADPALAHEASKKLLVFTLFYLAAEVLARGDDRERVLDALLLGGLALAALMVFQHHFLGFDSLGRRPRGFLGHYMSAAGVAMGVLVVAAARLAFGPARGARLRDGWLPAALLSGVGAVAALDALGHGLIGTRLFVAGLAAAAAGLALSRSPGARAASATLPLVALPVAAWALLVSQTRNAWVGAVAGLAVVAALRAPRLLWVVGAGVAAVLVLRPVAVTERLTVGDVSSRDRYYMWQAGIDMVLDRPVFGQGPGMILKAYPRYRWPEAPNPQQPHLHNNPLQIAAERGLPGLAFFTWWVAAAVVAAFREAGRAARAGAPGGGWAAVAALGVMAAVLVAGLFEYNLGDSEVLMLSLLLLSVPFALRRERAEA
jgi:O-antigen ligase